MKEVAVDETNEPKFKKGDWVVLKKEVVSRKAAINLMSRRAKRVKEHIRFDTDNLNWKNRFMKIKYLEKGDLSGCWFYSVNENYKTWYEDWLEKVE
jgi:hypothetical protein